MIVKIEDIQAWLAQRNTWNNTDINDIEFTYNGEPFEPQLFWLDENNEKLKPITKKELKFLGAENHTILEMMIEELES